SRSALETRVPIAAMPARRGPLSGQLASQRRNDHSPAISLTVLTQSSEFGRSPRHNIQTPKGLGHVISEVVPPCEDHLSLLNPEPQALLSHLIRPVPE